MDLDILKFGSRNLSSITLATLLAAAEPREPYKLPITWVALARVLPVKFETALAPFSFLRIGP